MHFQRRNCKHWCRNGPTAGCLLKFNCLFGKRVDGLAALVRETPGDNPSSGAIKCFAERRSKMLTCTNVDGARPMVRCASLSALSYYDSKNPVQLQPSRLRKRVRKICDERIWLVPKQHSCQPDCAPRERLRGLARRCGIRSDQAGCICQHPAD